MAYALLKVNLLYANLALDLETVHNTATKHYFRCTYLEKL